MFLVTNENMGLCLYIYAPYTPTPHPHPQLESWYLKYHLYGPTFVIRMGKNKWKLSLKSMCCVFQLALGYCVHPKAGQNTFLIVYWHFFLFW